VTGTYTVNPDCTGSATSTNGNADFSFVIVRGGAEFMGVATNPGDTWTIDLENRLRIRAGRLASSCFRGRLLADQIQFHLGNVWLLTFAEGTSDGH